MTYVEGRDLLGFLETIRLTKYALRLKVPSGHFRLEDLRRYLSCLLSVYEDGDCDSNPVSSNQLLYHI
jgi:hypothetical protein